MLNNVQAIILAGGISERFQTGKTKLLEKICGTEMILYPINLLKSLDIPTTIVIGFQNQQIKQIVQNKFQQINFILQHEPLGTGHATQITQSIWSQDHILLMNGDIPLLTPDIINKLYRKHTKSDADISFITAHAESYANQDSHIVIDKNQIKVVEQSTKELNASHCCISAGIYLAKRSFLEKYIQQLTKNETTKEYCLPELVQIASDNNCKIITTQVSFDIVRSVETISDLWAIELIRRSKLLQYWMDHGVRFANTFNIVIDETVSIEPGCFIGAGVILTGSTIIQKNCSIGAYTQIENSTIEHGCSIPSNMIISNITIHSKNLLQPFSLVNNSTNTITNTLFTGARKTEHQQNL